MKTKKMYGLLCATLFVALAGGAAADETELMSLYRKTLSAHLQRLQAYPEAARARHLEGEGKVRFRINRKGLLAYYKIEQSTGADLLDEAAIAMIRRANPFPPVPEELRPEDDFFEFVIPLYFRFDHEP